MKVIAVKYLPSRLPVSTTVITWLVLDRLRAPGFAWGVAGTVVTVLWVAALIGLYREQYSEPEWRK